MNNCLIVYPKRGFLNTEYKVRSNEKEIFNVQFHGQKIYEGTIQAGETKVLPKLSIAGEYIVVCNRTNERQTIRVEDALRLGSSDMKEAYIFDEFPYIYDTDKNAMFAHWQDRGDRIAFRNVTNVGFSIDDSKLMTISADGVIIVRNIKDVLNVQGEDTTPLQLSIAS